MKNTCNLNRNIQILDWIVQILSHIFMDTFPKGDKLSDLGIKNKKASPNFAFSVGYGSIVPRASQRPQNRR